MYFAFESSILKMKIQIQLEYISDINTKYDVTIVFHIPNTNYICVYIKYVFQIRVFEIHISWRLVISLYDIYFSFHLYGSI